MRSTEIRETFLKYFESKGHTRVASASLIPPNDPTLYFTNAGMVPFKEVFLGQEKRPYQRAASSQKCMRVSGKHNDLENVGYTPRHHTFFEMLGNFSFGDYFKEEAIEFAWEFLTQTVKLPREKLYITVFEKDDEAEKIWQKYVGKERIFKMGEKDNFWAMGETGPCGPCSEIIWDFGSGPFTQKDLETDRFFEVWNLVFMQFNRDASGKLNPLPKPSVDTGMGLERLACLLQNKQSNWETDLFAPLIQKIEGVTAAKDETATRVIADHVRAASFLIADGLFPSNEGRGYVLRRILRRAIRYGRRLGMSKPFFQEVARTVEAEMGDVYPELKANREAIAKVLTHEEERFLKTLDRGMEILEGEFKKLKKKTVPGGIVFKLYDTFGFPKDLTELIARERDFTIDEAGFEREMTQQRERARKSWKGSAVIKTDPAYQKLRAQNIKTEFVGYEKETADGKVVSLLQRGRVIGGAKEGEEAEMIVNATPFYAEGGGQVGDTGSVLGEDVELKVLDTQKPFPDLFVHHVQVVSGEIEPKRIVTLNVDSERRFKIKCHHTATHLLHAALRRILGTHVKQAGSYLDDRHLRFDFSHFSRVTDGQLADLEALVNQVVAQNLPITTEVLPYPEAIAKGALAFFGEKYGERVRMVQINGFSVELCGGTHLARTGDIGLFKITRERSVASGVRRIEALSGAAAQAHAAAAKKEAVPVKKAEAVPKPGVLVDVDALIQKVKTMKGVKVLAAQVAAENPAALRDLADRCRQKLGSGIVVLGADTGGKAALVVAVTKDLTNKFHAGDIVKKLASELGGTGGGRPDLAQGGGPDAAKLADVLKTISNII